MRGDESQVGKKRERERESSQKEKKSRTGHLWGEQSQV